ncbi:hypothetical protein [Yoonia vestfoldensis]|uniref:hypothetical protein n=1 Tax=Yoonia vestfoldensis TaxID=245188 RepID=UPI0003723641|nr:hypothetical protein [Yoonia vestfoldensis]
MRALVLLTLLGLSGGAQAQDGIEDCEFTQFTFDLYVKGCAEGEAYSCAARDKLAPAQNACQSDAAQAGTQVTDQDRTDADDPVAPAATPAPSQSPDLTDLPPVFAYGGPASPDITELTPGVRVESRDFVDDRGKYIYRLNIRNDSDSLVCCQVSFDYRSYLALRARPGQSAPVFASSRVCTYPNRSSPVSVESAVIGSVAWRIDQCSTRD